ncbi:hypothetical protein [Paenibacillus sp. KN14-4R]|uniref:hypothetical protein n=1 Tax=Paenibacillus sp. KN14-4R TaxID=3445773 RepID=UPI003F9FA95A
MQLQKAMPYKETARSPPKKLAVTCGTVHHNGANSEFTKKSYTPSLKLISDSNEASPDFNQVRADG